MNTYPTPRTASTKTFSSSDAGGARAGGREGGREGAGSLFLSLALSARMRVGGGGVRVVAWSGEGERGCDLVSVCWEEHGGGGGGGGEGGGKQ